MDSLLLELPTRLITCLDRHGLDALEDVVAMERDELEGLDGVGTKLLDALLDLFDRYDLEPGNELADAPLYPANLDELVNDLVGRTERWWSGRGVRMYRRFTPVSGHMSDGRGTCVVDTGATRLTVELSPSDGTASCDCGYTACRTHGLAASLFMAKDVRLQELFDRSVFEGTAGPPNVCPTDPLFFLLDGGTRKHLLNADVRWVEELVQHTTADLTEFRGIGPGRAERIQSFLQSMHLRPGDRPSSAERPPAERLPSDLGGYVFHLLDHAMKPDLAVKHFQSGRVDELDEPEEGVYRATVGDRQTHRATVDTNSATCSCSCSVPPERAPCAHAVAVALEAARNERIKVLSDRDREGIGEDLIWLLKQMKETSERVDEAPKIEDACWFLCRTGDGWSLRMAHSTDHPPDFNDVSNPKPERVRNPKDRALLRRMQDGNRRSTDDTSIPGDLLSLLTNRPLQVETSPGSFQPVRFPENGAKPVLRLTANGTEGFYLRVLFEIDGDPVPARSLERVSRDPTWLLDGQYLYHVPHHPLIVQLLDREADAPLSFTGEELTAFSEQVFPELLDRNVPVRMEEGLFAEADLQPEGRVYLHNRPDRLLVELRIAYGNVEFTRISGGRFPVLDPDSGDLLGVRRDPEEERDLLQRIRSRNLHSISSARPLRMEPDGDRGIWLMETLPELQEMGVEIYGEQRLENQPQTVSPDDAAVRVSGGMNWFELDGSLSYDDEEVTFADLLNALQDDQSYVQLSGNHYGEIPDRWIDRFGGFVADAVTEGDTVRIPGLSMEEINQLLEEAEDVQMDQTVDRYRQFYREFDGIDQVKGPGGFDGMLRDYQKKGLDWLQCLRRYRLGGLLADDMGLGKTVQVLAHLQLVREQEGTFPDTLVVAPRSVLSGWEREAVRFLPQPALYRHHGSNRRTTPDAWPSAHLSLTTYGTLREDISWLREVSFDTVVLDECQAIRNPDTKTAGAARLLDASHRIGLSGTPVQNTVMDLWSQFQFLNPGLLGSRSYFEETYAVPIENDQDEQRSHMLRERIKPFLLRRTKDRVERQLPELSTTRVDCPMEPAQEQLYESVRTTFRRDVSEALEKYGFDETRMKAMEGLTRLRQICCHPALLEGTELTASSKLQRFVELARDVVEEGHRALVFSQFVSFLDRIRSEVEQQGWSYTYLDGSTTNRDDVVSRFQSDESIPLFLISLQAGGEGLNLTGADYVFLMDPWWNPAVEQQAMDRTHRIGQDQPVFVYRLICPGTVEEKILELQEDKRRLSKDVVSPEGGVLRDMTRDDLMELFS